MSRRRMMMSVSDKIDETLPSEYTRLNYIEATGTQYINSGYLHSPNNHPYRVKVDFECTSMSKRGYIFGSTPDNTRFYPICLFIDSTNKRYAFARYGNGDITKMGARFGNLDLNRHIFEYVYKEGVYLDGILQQETIEQACIDYTSYGNSIYYSDSLYIGIFALQLHSHPSVLGFEQATSAKIYSLEFWNEIEIERKYIPAQRNSDGKIGLYEIITKEFFTNKGSVPFIGG